MPRVPRRDGITSTAPLPGLRVSASAPAAAFGSPQPVDFGGPARAMLDPIARRAAQVAVMDADNQLSQAHSDIEQKALQTKGANVLGVWDAAADDYDKRVGEIEGTLTGDLQKHAFQQIALERRQSLYTTVQRHMNAEFERHDDDVTKAALAQRMDTALANYQDPQAVATALEQTRAILTSKGQSSGWGPDVTAQAIADQASKLHVGVIGQMLDARQDRAARAYFDKNKDGIVGSDRGPVEKALEQGSTLGESQRQTDAILGTKNITEDAAYEKARAIDDPTVRQATMQQLDAEFARRARVERADRETATVNLIKDMRANGGKLNKGSLDWQLINGHAEGEHVLDVQSEILHPKEPGDTETYNRYLAMAFTSPATRQQLLDTPIEEILGNSSMSSGQKNAIINRIRGLNRENVAELRRQFSDADREAKTLKKLVDKAITEGDDKTREENEPKMFAAQQKAKLLQGQIQSAKRNGGAGQDNAPDAPTPDRGGDIDLRNQFGLSPAKPLTPDMLRGLHEAKGTPLYQAYVDHLRGWGFAVPDTLPALPEARKATP